MLRMLEGEVMNTTESGTEYELMVKSVYNRLYATAGVENPTIQHNVKFIGKSGATHQIDLYWEFTVAGVRHRVAVECKNYKNAVKKEKVAAFDGVLKDISGNIQGIFVCKNGYQNGALLYAESCGIQLMEIREPNDEDWKGRIRNIYIQLHMLFPENYKVHFVGDAEWLDKHYPEMMKQSELKICALNSDTFIEDEDEQISQSMLDLMNSLPRECEGKGLSREFEYNNAYFVYGEQRYKITKLKIEYDVCDYQDTIHICGDQIIQAIIMNSLDQSAKLLSFDGRVQDRK